MRRLVAIVSGIALVAVVGSLTLASASRTGAASIGWGARLTVRGSAGVVSKGNGGTTLVVISRNETIANVDNPPKGFSAGDFQAISSPLYKPNGQRIGSLDVHALVTLLDQSSGRERDLVTFTSSLPKGQIEATGAFVFSGQNVVSSTAAITGGTKGYDDVGGQVQVIFRQNDSKAVFHIKHLN